MMEPVLGEPDGGRQDPDRTVVGGAFLEMAEQASDTRIQCPQRVGCAHDVSPSAREAIVETGNRPDHFSQGFPSLPQVRQSRVDRAFVRHSANEMSVLLALDIEVQH